MTLRRGFPVHYHVFTRGILFRYSIMLLVEAQQSDVSSAFHRQSLSLISHD
ncbi:MAG: hypothetical protein RXP28_04890 [Nitrososphaeria archaeon]